MSDVHSEAAMTGNGGDDVLQVFYCLFALSFPISQPLSQMCSNACFHNRRLGEAFSAEWHTGKLFRFVRVVRACVRASDVAHSMSS